MFVITATHVRVCATRSIVRSRVRWTSVRGLWVPRTEARGKPECCNLTVRCFDCLKERIRLKKRIRHAGFRCVDLLDAHLPEAHVTDPSNGAVENGAAVALAVVVVARKGAKCVSEHS